MACAANRSANACGTTPVCARGSRCAALGRLLTLTHVSPVSPDAIAHALRNYAEFHSHSLGQALAAVAAAATRTLRPRMARGHDRARRPGQTCRHCNRTCARSPQLAGAVCLRTARCVGTTCDCAAIAGYFANRAWRPRSRACLAFAHFSATSCASRSRWCARRLRLPSPDWLASV
jgi:hypothetical protein